MSKAKHPSRRHQSVTQALTPEAMSALMDGYLPSSALGQDEQIDQLLDQLLRDGDLAEQRRSDWDIYHRIGDVMRNELTQTVSQGVEARQPTPVKSATKLPDTVTPAKTILAKLPDTERTAVNWPSWIATAAALVAVTWMLEVTDLGFPTGGEPLVAQVPNMTEVAEWTSPSSDWQEFVREHQQAGGMALPTAGSAAVFRAQIDAVRVENLTADKVKRPSLSTPPTQDESEAWYRLWDQPLRSQPAPGGVH